MARLNSFYFPADYWPKHVGDTALLKGTEARHMVTVLRTAKDQTVRLFDGKGRDGLFRIKEISNTRVLLEAVSLKQHPKPVSGITLAIGWSKSKRRNYLFEKAVELKANGIAFWSANRSQGQIPLAPKESWREKCVQAAKQCGNPYLPSLSMVSGGIKGLQAFALNFDNCFLAWESESASTPLTPEHFSRGRSLVVIGPEGGFNDSEAIALVDGGFSPVTLGDSVLRWETAATYCLSLGFFAQQEL